MSQPVDAAPPDPPAVAAAPEGDVAGDLEGDPEDDPAVPPLPGWIPVMIGLVLVGLAALAVITGTSR